MTDTQISPETSSPRAVHLPLEGQRDIRRIGRGPRLAAVRARLRDETGAATAEYAIATMAAVGFAGLLVVIMRSDEVRAILTDLVHRALTFAG